MSNTGKISKRFKANKGAFLSLWIVVIFLIMAVFATFLIPDKSIDANTMYLSLSLKKPGFKTTLFPVKTNMNEKGGFFQDWFIGHEPVFKYIPVSDWKIQGENVVLTLYGEPGDAPVYKTLRISDIFPGKNYTNPKELTNVIKNRIFWLGTDRYGRDMLSRVVLGTRITFSVGLISVIISLVVGIFLGSLAGYFRGWIDVLVMWFINVVWSVPTLLLVIAITLALGKGFWQVFIAVGLTTWVEVARVVRGQIFSLREMDFVQAGKALGYNNSRIIFRHILPNIIGPVAVIAASNFATAILLESGLSFLGIGAQPPTPTWGTMIRENYPYILMDLAFLAVIPGILIMLMVLCFNLLGNGLRDAFDSRESAIPLS